MALQRLSLIGFLIFADFCFAQTSPTPTPMPEASETGIEGVITVGPIHGGAVRPGIPSSKPLANAAFVVGNDAGAVAEFTTDAQGRFKVLLAPGHYTVTKKEQQKGIGRYGPFEVDVVAGQMTKVGWQCDTGMR
jgi:Prealbumin-like fold domain